MMSQNKVPQIRFVGFNREWEEKRLIEVVEFIGTGRSTFNLSAEKTEDKSYPVLGSRTLIGYDGEYDYSGNFILTARVGENAGRLYRYSGKVKISDNTVYIEAQNLDYFFYFLTKFDLKKLAFGTGQPLIKASELSNLKLMLPSEAEQTKIGNYFHQLDKLIEQKEKKHQKLKQFKKAMLDKMFPKNGANTPEIRFEGFSGEWEERKLGNIATFSKGKGISKSEIAVDGERECIRYGELYTAYNEVITTIYSKTDSNIDMVYSEENDMLMPTSDVTPTGLATASALSQSGIILGGDILIIRSEKIVNIFFSYFVKGHKNTIIKLVSGTTVFHLYAKDIENLNLYLPNKEEQTKIGNYFQTLDKQIDLQNKEIEKLKNIKKASLDKMFV